MSDMKMRVQLIRQHQESIVNRVGLIKTIRTFTGHGLKESKEIHDTLEKGESVSVDICFGTEVNTTSLIAAFSVFGIAASCDDLTYYREQLKELATVATMKGDYYAASSILQLLSTKF